MEDDDPLSVEPSRDSDIVVTSSQCYFALAEKLILNIYLRDRFVN